MRLGHREERSESIQVKRLTPIHAFGVRLSDAIVPSGMRFLVGVLDSDKCRDQSRHDADARNDRFSSDPIVPYAQIAVIGRRSTERIEPIQACPSSIGSEAESFGSLNI